MPRKQRFKPSRKPKQDTIPNAESSGITPIRELEPSRNPGQPADIDVDSGRSEKTEPDLEETQEAG